MTPQQFIKKWNRVALTERASAQSHFIDLCALLGHDDPVTADPTGELFTFEKGATKTGGGEGFADVWKKGFFAWEYKKKKHDLDAALAQLVRYAAALENPPLQIACDTDRFLIRTAWTNAVPKTYSIALKELTDPKTLDILHSVFFNPEKLRPKETRAAITREAADKFSEVAQRLQPRGSPEEVAHFVNQLVFCFFAHSVRLLPNGFFPRLLKRASQNPENAQQYFDNLFAAMEKGGDFDLTQIAHFNGGLFDGRRALPLDSGDIALLTAASSLDWSQIDPSIFGTLFERFLDPQKRGQIGAHYTDAEKIMMIVDPVIVRPLSAQWVQARIEIEALLNGTTKPPMRAGRNRRMAPLAAAEEVRSRYLERLRTLKILDPACGSGNFLYLSLQSVKDLELKANHECEALGLSPRVPAVGPEILRGIEINPLAAELARTTIWIGDIQWGIRNAIYTRPEPILRPLHAIECRDAILELHRDGKAVEADWPHADFIVGNPPFLGSKFFRKGRPARRGKPGVRGLGDDYTEKLYEAFDGCVPRSADLCSYWFLKAGRMLARQTPFGLVATKSISKGANNAVLRSIVQQDEVHIFDAWTNEPWIIDGAEVRVSLICVGRQVKGKAVTQLNGKPVTHINADLTTGLDIGLARPLQQNASMAFQGVKLNGPFEIDDATARQMLSEPANVNGHPNSRVVKRFVQNDDVTERPGLSWVIDFSEFPDRAIAAQFQAPFEFVAKNVLPYRNRLETSAASETDKLSDYWLMQRPRPMLRRAIQPLARCILVPETSEHRIFVFSTTKATFSGSLFVIAREDYLTFGILSSRFHDAWATAQGNRLGAGNQRRYNATRTFETYPFPDGLTVRVSPDVFKNDPRATSIESAAKTLDHLRNKWLCPAELIRIEPEIAPGYPDRILAKNAQAAANLKDRTLTNLYNKGPQWLVDAHRHLDDAVADAYGWPRDISEENALAKLLELNLARTAAAGTAAREEDGSDDEE